MSDQVTPAPEEGLDAVTSWLSGAKSAEYGFFLAVYIALDHFTNGNRDPLAKMITVCNGKKAKRIRNVEGQKLMYSAPLKRILQHCLANVGVKADASKDFGVAWTVPDNAGVNRDKTELVKALAQGGESPRGKTFRDVFPPLANGTAKEKTEAELLAAKKAALVKWCGDNGIKLDVLVHTLQDKGEPNF